jgi:hypothetical protein
MSRPVNPSSRRQQPVIRVEVIYTAAEVHEIDVRRGPLPRATFIRRASLLGVE